MQGRQCLFALLLFAATANAADAPTKPAAPPSFTGEWHVAWCDKDEPTRECGGFTAAMVQDGERISGVGSGATIGLGRMDDCSTIEGIAVDDKAYVLIRSARMGWVLLVDARHVDGGLSWKVRESVTNDQIGDRDVIAYDAVLKRMSGDTSGIERCKAPG